MSWEDVIKRNKKQRIEGLSSMIKRFEKEIGDPDYYGDDGFGEEYIRGLIEELEKKELNDILPESVKKELLDFFQDYSQIMWRKKNILPNLRYLRSYIEEYDTDE